MIPQAEQKEVGKDKNKSDKLPQLMSASLWAEDYMFEIDTNLQMWG